MEMEVKVRLKENILWKHAVLSDSGADSRVVLKSTMDEKSIEIPPDNVLMIRVDKRENFDKERYTVAIVLIHKALQAGFKVIW